MDDRALVVDAFTELDLDVQELAGDPMGSVDLVIEPEGVAAVITVAQRSLVNGDVAQRLLEEPGRNGSTLFVVADRVTDEARKILMTNRSGYLDLRGHLALRVGGLVIDAKVTPVAGRMKRSDALGGKAGLEIATAMLREPERPVAVRSLARELGRSPSTVSDVLAALRRDGLTDTKSSVSGPDLFWAVADRWRVAPIYLAQMPERAGVSTNALHLWLDAVEDEPGWALTDSAAAVAYGAPVAVRSGHLLEFYVPTQAIARRATNLLGAATSESSASCVVRAAPVPAVCRPRIAPLGGATWPLAHPLFVALDLAQDVGRGREVLDAWTPPDRWTRVW